MSLVALIAIASANVLAAGVVPGDYKVQLLNNSSQPVGEQLVSPANISQPVTFTEGLVPGQAYRASAARLDTAGNVIGTPVYSDYVAIPDTNSGNTAVDVPVSISLTLA
jgi:hypothetical protein